MMDKILIRDLKAPAIIGVLDWERKVRQELLLDLDLFLDTSTAARSDNFELTVDYSAVAELLISKCANSSFKLIESLAAHLMEEMLHQYPQVERARLRVKKPGAVPQAAYVGIEIERSRSHS